MRLVAFAAFHRNGYRRCLLHLYDPCDDNYNLLADVFYDCFHLPDARAIEIPPRRRSGLTRERRRYRLIAVILDI